MYGPPPVKDLDLFGSQRKPEPELFPRPQLPPQPNMALGQAGNLLRYRSAPSSLFGEVEDNFGLAAPPRQPSPDTDFAGFLVADFGDSKPGLYHTAQQMHGVDGVVFRAPTAEGGNLKSGSVGVGSGVIAAQTSSPAGFGNHLNAENGFLGLLRGGVGGGGEMGARLKGQLSYSSSRQGSLMSQISESIESDDAADDDEEDRRGGAAGGGRWGASFPFGAGSWEDSPSPVAAGGGLGGDNSSAGTMKRAREHHPAAGDSAKTPAPDMASLQRFLQFQDAVPCKIRAKRGCATHPRSIAERVRRTRISERIRKLQELVPNMDKQTNTADMLDLAVDYIKELQKQVKVLDESRASCSCGTRRQKQ